jgi:hypothetical protein
MVYWQNCEQHRVDEFLEIHPQFSDIPRNAVQICLGLAPNILGVNKSLIIAGERLYPPLLIPKRYSALINLTTSPQPASHELIFKESFGASTRDLVLPGATNDVISDYSIELTHNRYSYWNRVFEISKKAENKSGAALLIVTDAPVLFCSKLRANNIQSILLEEEPLTIESAKIFVCRPSNSHAIIFGASYAANDITTPNPRIDVLITNYIENPEELQRIKQIGSRSGISTSITHLIQKESLSRLNPHELLNLIQEDSKADPSSIHLKNSINFVRDADSLLHYFLYARRSKTIEVIKRALTRYKETLQLPEASLCELPGLADAILISLYHKYRTQISEAGALPDSLSIANQQYLDSDKDSEMVTLKEIFKNHFGRDVRDFLDDIADLDSQLKAKDNPIFEGYFEAPQMEGSNYGLEANDLHNLYVSLTDLFRLYVRQLALINQAMSKITEDTTLTFIRQLSD